MAIEFNKLVKELVTKEGHGVTAIGTDKLLYNEDNRQETWLQRIDVRSFFV